jgi:hypothetical protein
VEKEMRKKVSLLITSLFLISAFSFRSSVIAESGVEVLQPTEDTYVSGGSYFAIFGDEEQLNIADYITQQVSPGGLERVFHVALLKFDVSSLPSDLEFISVKLYLYCENIEEGPARIQIFHCDSNDWEEHTLNHLYYAEHLIPYVHEEGSEETTIETENQWYAVDVTDDFVDYRGVTITKVLKLGAKMLGKSIYFSSKEGDHPPYLEVVFEKKPSLITCIPSSNIITLGDAVSITGKLMPAIEDAKVTFHYQNNETILETYVYTDSNGSYSIVFEPSLDGLWNITAEWAESDYYLSANTAVYITVNPLPDIPADPERENNLPVALMITLVIVSLALIGIIPIVISSRKASINIQNSILNHESR